MDLGWIRAAGFRAGNSGGGLGRVTAAGLRAGNSGGPL